MSRSVLIVSFPVRLLRKKLPCYMFAQRLDNRFANVYREDVFIQKEEFLHKKRVVEITLGWASFTATFMFA